MNTASSRILCLAATLFKATAKTKDGLGVGDPITEYKQIMKIALFYLMYLPLIFSDSDSSIPEDNIMVLNMFQGAMDNLIFRNEILHTDSIIEARINLATLEVIPSKNCPLAKIYYHSGKIVRVCVKELSDFRQDYYLYHSGDFVYYNIFLSSKDQQNYFAPGFFVMDKTKNRNIFVGLKHHAFMSLNFQVSAGKLKSDWRFQPNVTINSVERIFLLDENLSAISRLNWYEGDLLSYSKVSRSSQGGFTERIKIYPTGTCEGNTKLSLITIPELYNFLDDRSCSSPLILEAKPRVRGFEQSLWASPTGNRYY